MKRNSITWVAGTAFLAGIFCVAGSSGAGLGGEEGMPNPFPPNHYERLEEYSPFVKSLESGKLMEKSPELVIVGYGRVRGEDHVIVQQKDSSEKREKIGTRWGSSAFPYRLLSITNASNRKTFKATLEDRNGRRREIGYASEAQTVAQSAGSNVSTNPVLPKNQAPGGGLTNVPTLTLTTTVERLQTEILKLSQRINDPALTDAQKVNMQKAVDKKQEKLDLLLNPADLQTVDEVAPQTAP